MAASRVPGVVVIQHAPGVDSVIHSVAERLSNAGYAAIAPDLYHRQDATMPLGPLECMDLLKDIEVMADVNAAVAYLRSDARVDPERIGVLGFCMGGRVAYLLAAANQTLKAAVVYYGGNIKVPWGEQVPTPFARTPQINCPILFHFGDEDDNPSPADRRMLDAELTRHGKAHEFYHYPNAGHAFMNFTNAERYRQAATEVAWPRTLAFLDRCLKS
ncbi:MAG: dienelactone hydrolase family protein [Gammaproteobacteria bacterium]|nr:dienelactone hydrolase family protein [Gammaproteobacteria bacterium]